MTTVSKNLYDVRNFHLKVTQNSISGHFESDISIEKCNDLRLTVVSHEIILMGVSVKKDIGRYSYTAQKIFVGPR
jgi:hypothetical protein